MAPYSLYFSDSSFPLDFKADLCTLNYFKGITIHTKGTKYVLLMLPPQRHRKVDAVCFVSGSA